MLGRLAKIVLMVMLLSSCQKEAIGECVAFEKEGQIFVIEIFDAPSRDGKYTDRTRYADPRTTIEELREAALDSPCNQEIRE